MEDKKTEVYEYVITDMELGDVKVTEGKLTRFLRARDEKRAIKAATIAAMNDEELKAYKRQKLLVRIGTVVAILGAAGAAVVSIARSDDEDESSVDEAPEENVIPIQSIETEWEEIPEEEELAVSE